MFARLVRESFLRNPKRKSLTAAALMVGMAVTTATLTVALDVGDRMAREFRSLGANLMITPQSDTLPVNIGGVDYRPVDEGAYLNQADLGKLKMIFWRHNILGITPFLDVPAEIQGSQPIRTTLIGTWYEHSLPVPDGTTFKTGLSVTHPWWKVQGRWFESGAKECVVGTSLAASYPGGMRPGMTISLAARDSTSPGAAQAIPLLVTGIASTGGAEDKAVLAPLSVAQDLSGHPGKVRQVFVSALTKPEDSLAGRDPKTLTATEYDQWFCSPYISSIQFQIKQSLPGTDVRAIRRVADTEGRILSRISTLLWIVTLAALTAAGLAVASTAATAILRRRAEIGIMKAIGGTNGMVSSIFLVEQMILATLGGAIGYFIGTGLARILGKSVFGVPATPRLILLPIVLGLAALVAVVGSVIPLRQAAHYDPAPILRGE